MGVIGKRRITSAPQPASLHHPIVEIAARHEIEPFRQGGLDLLCGLLSPLNAVRLALHDVAPISNRRSRELFKAGAELLYTKRGGPEALYAGMGTRRSHQIARHMAKRASSATCTVDVQRPDFETKPQVADVLAWIEASIAAGAPVMLRLVGRGIDHFTVVAATTPTRFWLFDSCGHRFIKRASCEGPDSYYRIPPKALLRIAVSRRG